MYILRLNPPADSMRRPAPVIVSRGVRAVLRELARGKKGAPRHYLLWFACSSPRPDFMAMTHAVATHPATPRYSIGEGMDVWAMVLIDVAMRGRANVLRLLHREFGIPRDALTLVLRCAARQGCASVIREFWHEEACWSSVLWWALGRTTFSGGDIFPDPVLRHYSLVASLIGAAVRSDEIVGMLLRRFSPSCCPLCDADPQDVWKQIVLILSAPSVWLLPRLVSPPGVNAMNDAVVRAHPRLREVAVLLRAMTSSDARSPRAGTILSALLLTRHDAGALWRADSISRDEKVLRHRWVVAGRAWVCTLHFAIRCGSMLPDEIWEEIANILYRRWRGHCPAI